MNGPPDGATGSDGCKAPASLAPIFEPLEIGAHTVRNRVFMSASTVMFSTDNLVNDRHVAYYAERAKGGIGLVIPEELEVHPSAAGAPIRWLIGWREEVVPHFRRLTDAVHAHGASTFAQLDHAGTIHDPARFDAPMTAFSASAFGHPGRETPKAMSLAEIADVIAHYRLSARHAYLGGFDGIEIHAAHGHLPAQFLSPLSNRRSDMYGGSLANRMRFMMQALEAVRTEVPDDYPVGFRISASEFAPGGMDLEETAEVAAILGELGSVSFLDVSGGRPPYSYHKAIPTFEQPEAHLRLLSRRIKEAFGRPVFVIGRIVDPLVAADVVAAGDADMVGMLRAHIADPELVNKARAGRLDEIRYCISCNQECYARVAAMTPITCIQNPTAGRELVMSPSTITPAPEPRRVLVVGGGPAGMEFAWVAARRGHEVRLFEAEGELGGQARLHGAVPRRREFTRLVGNLERLMASSGVGVKTGKRLEADDILGLEADVVVVATGSLPRRRDAFAEWRPDLEGLPGFDREEVLSSHDVLSAGASLGRRVVLADGDGRHEAGVVAEFLAAMVEELEIVTPFAHFGPALALTLELGGVYRSLLEAKATITPFVLPERYEGSTLVVRNLHSGETRCIEGVDRVVALGGNVPNDALYCSLVERGIQVHAIGDCVQPRRIAQAMYQARKLALEL